MSEILLSLEQADPALLWGTNNEHFEILKKYFPKLKIVARGTQVKVLGSDNEIALFNTRFDQLLKHLEKFSRISAADFEQILRQEQSAGADREAVREVGLGEVIVYGPHGNMVRARSENQLRMVEGAYKNDIVFAIGPAGTGKTYTAVALAVRARKNKEVKRIILTRPAVEAGENLGFLPGDLKEKIDPYLRPL
ncbi:MAG TPA: PhoH family protein, partial [Anseongella sp.]